MQNVRAFFEKKGDARFLSHLDVMRCFTRALKRTKLDVWYTQGFNSHIYLVFSNPLSLGFESEYETVDFRIVSDDEIDFDDVKEKINLSLPEGIKVVRCDYPLNTHNEILYSEWSIVIPGPEDVLYESFGSFLNQDVIQISRTNKKGQVKTENAIDYIKSIKYENTNGNLIVNAILMSSNSASLNPSVLLKAFLEFAGIEENDYRICRKTLLLNNMKPFK